MVLASCSQNEVAEINRDGDEIRFNVVTNKATKATDVYCNANMPGSFYVSAITDGKTYIANDKIEKKGDSWVNAAGTRYWPETAVDFYAHVNAGTTFSCEKESEDEDAGFVAKFTNFQPSTTVANQVDLLYAVKMGEEKKEEQVMLNFRHALSQIVFQARNDSKNLYVEIAEVAIANIGGKATFTFPSVNTDNNISHENPTYDANGKGIWNEFSNAETYRVSVVENEKNVVVEGNKTIVDLTADNNKEEDFSKAMLLLPQTAGKWVPETYPDPKVEENKGAYFLVKCRIWNVADPTTGFNSATDVCLWGTDEAKDVAIPVAINWEQGKRYLYTLVFGNGNGGYNPEPDDPDPDPVLVPITFDVDVDEFVPENGRDIESGVPEESGE